jgi:hypothetical protein
MIPFFRKLRQNLLAEGRTLKYLQYAVGEIVLVVIGILIALQINIWNESRKDLEKEQLVLKQLKEEYEANLLQLEEKMAMRDEIIASCMKILEYIDHPQGVSADSLTEQLGPLIIDPTFDPIQNDLISSGNIRLIRNKKLQVLLSRWTSEVLQLTETELVWQKLRSELYIPFVSKTGLSRDAVNYLWKDENVPIFILNRNARNEKHIGKSAHAHDVAAILANPELEGVATNAFTFNHVCNLQSQVLHERIAEILSLLNAEIKD